MAVAPEIVEAGQVQIIDNNGNEAVGEVVAVPTRLTILGRLKDIADAVVGTYTTPTNAAVDVGTTTTEILAANPDRLYALIVNDSDVTIYVGLGVNAVLNTGIRLSASGGSYEMSKAIGNLYVGAINGIHGGVGAKAVGTVEGV